MSGRPFGSLPNRMRDGVRWATICVGVLMVMGSLLPWASLGIFSVPGTDGDGVFTLGIGVIVAIIGIANKPTLGAFVGLLLMAAIALWVSASVAMSLSGEGLEGSMGSGLVLVMLAAAATFVVSFQVLKDVKAIEDGDRPT